MARRSGLEIMAEILFLCQEPRTKTRIMYATNLSYTALSKYLSRLQHLKLLEIHQSTTTYITTLKGSEFLRKWIELKVLVEGESNQILTRDAGVHPVKNSFFSFSPSPHASKQNCF